MHEKDLNAAGDIERLQHAVNLLRALSEKQELSGSLDIQSITTVVHTVIVRSLRAASEANLSVVSELIASISNQQRQELLLTFLDPSSSTFQADQSDVVSSAKEKFIGEVVDAVKNITNMRGSRRLAKELITAYVSHLVDCFYRNDQKKVFSFPDYCFDECLSYISFVIRERSFQLDGKTIRFKDGRLCFEEDEKQDSQIEP